MSGAKTYKADRNGPRDGVPQQPYGQAIVTGIAGDG